MAKINLRKFIAEHYKAGIATRDVVREAITNSIQAGARVVSVDLTFSAPNQEMFAGSDERRVLERVSIIDDGEGFTIDNLQYFDEICTGHKDSIGGKGVGRLSFLKFAKKVKIESQLVDEFIQFDYTPDFSLNDVQRVTTSGAKRTSIVLDDLKDQINTQVTKLINSICDDLRLLLFLKSQQSENIEIRFAHNSQQSFPESYSFCGKDITALATKSFNIQNEEFACYLFKDEPPRKGIVAMLCADELCVEEYSISKKFDVCRHLIFVTSNYFNRRSNIERQRLEIPKTEGDVDLVSPISRDKLLPRIHDECMGMISQLDESGIDEFKEGNIEKLRKYYPFINIKSLGGEAALLDADEIVRNYRMQQAKKEDQLVDDLVSGKIVSIDDISHLASDDLARYIVHRALIIDSLANMPAGSAEDAIHQAILPKRINGNEVRENNVWLVDDKFLSYSSIYSDETLSKIIRDVNSSFESKQLRKPDVAAFFSKDNENQPNKLVVIEFKKPGADIFENAKSLTQCRLYASELSEKIPTVMEVFAFSIVDVDDEFYRELKQTNYKDIFSLKERVVYQDFNIGSDNAVPLHLYVMPAASLIKDARARNKVFEDVLQFNL
ncbi:ATP-binding protein [Janthinobacterium sp. SUN137]|uniref:ATP-binding protein n=1 Tax=Janthinobacterium sp. SUN137 TaxID=3014789 RepID=UPI0027127B2C|nr:ATP-binding protein [Janthinobacterium sp. SUN137]MDO8039567.1 ATP-binding protein [Janthinobacterium sp. SUN137]